jgi:4-carboxymuconolactone decarboxylase
MPRVPEITSKDRLAPEYHAIFDSIAESRGQVGGPFAVLLNSPEVAGRVAHLGTYLRFENSLPEQLRELAIITTAREWGCALEWGAHVQLAQRLGLAESTIDVVGRRLPDDGLPEDQRSVVRYARELVNDHRVSTSTFDAARRLLGDRGVTDLTGTIGYYGMLACALNAFEVPAREGAPPIPTET